jgi:C4-dicarboxylate transporter DctQ subunit
VKLVRKLTVIFDRIIEFMAFLAGIILMFLVLMMSAAIFSRYLLGYPIGFIVEIGKYGMVYITFLVAAWVLRQEGHVGIEAVVSRFKPGTQSLINAVTSAICVIPCFILVWFGAKVTWDFFQSGYFTATLLELPQCILIAIIPVGIFLLGIQLVRRTGGYLRSRRASADKKVVD